MNSKLNKTTPADLFLTVNRPKSSIEDSIESLKSSNLEKELAILNDEQESYDQINELEIKMMNIRSELRRERAEIESTKSQIKLLEIIVGSKIKQSETSLKYSVESLESKFTREQGTTNGYVEYMQKSIAQQKREDESMNITSCNWKKGSQLQNLSQGLIQLIMIEQYFQFFTDLDEAKVQEITEAYNKLDVTEKWSEQQIRLLKCLISTYCQHHAISQYQVPDNVFVVIAKMMNRSVIDCKLHMCTKKKIRLLQQQWQKREDEVLKEICFANQGKPFKWSEIAKELAAKCNNEPKLAKFVRDRWLNKLNPDIQKGPWGVNEEHQLLKFMIKHGKNWVNIANEVNHQRTESSLKNRYFNILRKLEKKDIPLLNKQQTIEELEQLKIEKTDKTDELGQQEISFIIYYLKSIQKKVKDVVPQPAYKNYNKKTKTQTKELHAKNVLNKVLQQFPQDDNIDYSKMKDHFQDVIAQKGDTVELDEEPLSDSNNLSEVQFAIMGKDSQNLHVFPKSQLKAVMDLMKQKKESKTEVQQSINKISSLPPPLPKVEVKQQSQQPQPQVPVQIPVMQPLMQPVPMSVPIIPVSQQQPPQPQQQSNQQQQQQQIPQQQQQPMYQIVYPSNFMYPQVQMAPVAQIPLIPGQMPQMIGQLPGQMMQAIPGQMMQPIPGQMMQQMPGQMPQMIQSSIIQPIPMQNGQLQMPQMAQLGQMPQIGQMPQLAQMQQMAMQQMPIAGQQGPQQFIPIIYTPQPMFQQQGQQQQQQQPQQMPMMNYQFPMMPAYDPYFQYINQIPQQKQPKYSQVKQEQEEQNRK